MPSRYDVFLSHSSTDKPAVEEIARKLREVGVEPFLDKWHLIPGDPWQEALEEALKQSATCAVFLGPSGMGPWQNEEMRVALDRRTRDRASRVIPVLLPQARQPKEEIPLFLTRLTWVDFGSGLNDEEAFRRFIAGIRGEAPGPGGEAKPSRPISNYRSMAPPSQGFIHRKEYDRVVEALCTENPHGSAVGITTALRGAGGFGKTALAQAVCQDERIRKKYPDGILWTTMGEEVSESGRLSRLRDLIRWWAPSDPPVFETLGAASAFLRDLLTKRRTLLVLDDVWLDLDLVPFQGLSSALLITTREKDILPSGSKRIDVDAMEIPEAVNLLRAGLPEWEISLFSTLARRLGEWPLLLKLTNRQLLEMVEEDGFSIGEALQKVESILKDEGMTAFDRDNSESRQSAVEKTLAVSLRRLNESELARYSDLAVFPEDAEIPVSVLERFWGHSRDKTERLCRRLDHLSLLLHFDRRQGIVQLHDVIRHYLVHRERENLPNIHHRFLEALHPASGRWRDLPEEESYLWKHLGHHFVEAGERGVLRDLLLDFSFLQAKLRATDVNALLADYDPFVKDDEELRLVQGSIRLSAPILKKNPDQLAPHLLGRLLGGETSGLQHVLEQCRKASFFRPRVPSFRPPSPLLFTLKVGSPAIALVVDSRRAVSGSTDRNLQVWDLETGKILRTLEGHTDWIRAVAVVDDLRAISGSNDRTLRIWDLETGQTLRTFKGHTNRISTVAVVDGRRVISGSEDRTLRVWDLETGQTLRTLKGHTASISTLAVMDDRRAVSGSEDETLRVWDLETGKTLQTLKGHTASVRAVAVVDSRRVVSGSNDETLRVWDLETGQTLRILQGHTEWVRTMAVMDDRRTVSASTDRTLRVWDLETGQTLRILEGHTALVRAVAMVDGRRAVSGSADGSLRIWSLESGECLAILVLEAAVITVAVAPDQQTVVVGDLSGRVHFLELADRI